ncbi:MAG: zinc ribbon domain-containing protein [Chloroflexota bacterium]|nr:zinc ribbon domain-containing protein [Chloroflexota bacterium]
MATCISCGTDVTGKRFCQQCGTPTQPADIQPISAQSICPHCSGEVKPGAAFCMHCGSSLSLQAVVVTAPSQPLTQVCSACHTEVPAQNAFCTNCGQSMQTPAPPSVTTAPIQTFCTNCGYQNVPGVRFCASCGNAMATTATPPIAQSGYPQSGPYPQQPQPYPTQYGQPQYPQQQYAQQGQMSYQPDPMLRQQPMVLRCQVCMAMSPLGTSNCPSCHTSLVGIVPTPANIPVQGQQGGMGGLGSFMQGNGGKYAMGALGGAAAVIGGEMLLHGVEHNIERGVEGDMGYGRRREDEGLLGGLGDLANDIGLF